MPAVLNEVAETGRAYIPAVNGEGEAAAVEVGRGEHERNEPRDRDQLARPRLAVNHHRTQRVNDRVVPAAQTKQLAAVMVATDRIAAA